MTASDRFWAKVQKTPECWVWVAGRDGDGYGFVYWQGRTRKAHRVSFQLSGYALDEGDLVLHLCGHPWCVNPAHLYAGTHSDNMRDRGALPPRRHMAKSEITQALATNGSVARAAERLGVSRRTLHRWIKKAGIEVERRLHIGEAA
jgi:hypothetical protein